MRHYRGSILIRTSGFLACRAPLPYDGFAPESGKVRRKSHWRTHGCAFRSAEGGEAPRGHVLQRATLLSVEFLFATLSHPVAPYVTPAARHVIIYHLLTEGRASARLADGPRIILEAGDIVIFPHGDPHFLENGSPNQVCGYGEGTSPNFFPRVEAVVSGWWRGNYKIRLWLYGLRSTTEPSFLSGLPPLFKVSIRNDASGRWLENSIRFSVNEADPSRSGGEAVLAKLSEVLFIETLRAYIAQLPAEQTGWLAGAP